MASTDDVGTKHTYDADDGTASTEPTGLLDAAEQAVTGFSAHVRVKAPAVPLPPAARFVAPRCRSFSADTQVLLGDGTTTAAISELEVGDEVWAHDPDTGETGPRQVEAVWPHYDWLLNLDVDGGSVTTTEDHHFWNDTDQQWQESQHIDIGEDLLASDGGGIEVLGLDESTLRFDLAYDLTVSEVHTYLVSTGIDDVLVHNCTPGSYAPDRPLPRTKHGDPIPDVDAPHTQLGTRADGTGTYTQARQWEVNPRTGRLEPTRDIDFTDHGLPAGHTSPHQHVLTPNNPATVPRGGVQGGSPSPFVWGWTRF